MSAKISKAAFARKLGISKAAVSRYASMGMPQTADGCVDPAIAAKWIRDNIRIHSSSRGRGLRAAARLSGGRYGKGQGESAAIDAHTRLLKLRGDRLELENACLKGGTGDERARRHRAAGEMVFSACIGGHCCVTDRASARL